ncbi:MAG TPA: hypothetical protein VKU86_10470 [Acidimicrobiales bacterium]|nr:hypothetical protein [Acidimicrobiales bacterium]
MRPRALIGSQPVASGILDNGRGLITFWSFREATGSATAEVRLVDGSSAAGTEIAAISLAANESTRDAPPHPFIPYRTGLFLELVSGQVRGQVFSLVHPDCDHYALPMMLVNIDQLTLDVTGG